MAAALCQALSLVCSDFDVGGVGRESTCRCLSAGGKLLLFIVFSIYQYIWFLVSYYSFVVPRDRRVSKESSTITITLYSIFLLSINIKNNQYKKRSSQSHTRDRDRARRRNTWTHYTLHTVRLSFTSTGPTGRRPSMITTRGYINYSVARVNPSSLYNPLSQPQRRPWNAYHIKQWCSVG